MFKCLVFTLLVSMSIMATLAFALFLSMALIGCGTENPICTDNYCIRRRDFLKV